MITKEHATETLQMEFGKGSYAIPDVHYLGLSTSAISEDTGTGLLNLLMPTTHARR